MSPLRKSSRISKQQTPIKRKSRSKSDNSSTNDEDSSNSSEDKQSPVKSPSKKPKIDIKSKIKENENDSDSSSSSSSEELFKNPKSFDFKSEFFKPLKSNTFNNVEIPKSEEKSSRLSSESEDESENKKTNGVEIVSNYFTLPNVNEQKKIQNVKKKTPQKQKTKGRKKKEKNFDDDSDEEMTVSQILALGEKMNVSEVKVDKKPKRKVKKQSSDSEDWEDVDDLKNEEINKQISIKDVEVKIEMPGLDKKKQSKHALFQQELRKHLNRKIRHVQELKHKVNLLCLIAYSQLINNKINSENVMALALSLIPSQYGYPKEKVNLNYGNSITSWFSKTIKLRQNSFNHRITEELLEKNLSNKTACCKRDFVIMFVSLLRAIGLKARFVMSLQPVTLRPKSEDLCKIVIGNESTKPDPKEKIKQEPSTSKASTSKVKKESVKTKKTNKEKQTKQEKQSKQTTKKTTKTNKKKTNESSDEDEKFLHDRSVLSSDDDTKTNTSNHLKYCDFWAELFLEDVENWICLDPTTGKADCIAHIYKNLTPPVYYILAFNNDLSLKDVTKRYDPLWLTSTQKKRVDKEWWDKSLKPFAPPRGILEDIEERTLLLKLQNKPLPKSITEYKDHPLYALKRHLLKFEAIYPNECVPIGYVKSEPVYPRESVYTLHSRETWLKDAKVVKMGEEPYKIVKARPKWDKLTRTVISDQPLHIFGPWQVEDYVPPIAKDGVVPRNCYGNVDLFKPSMLPVGTVHIQGSGLNKVARKLGIDCAPAVTGFDFHSGACHPLIDGYVVCEEYKETLLEAWQQEMEEAEKRHEEKRQKIIYDRWKLLIKGLLIRERLKLRYDLGNNDEEAQSSNSQKEEKKPKKEVKKKISNVSTKSTNKKKTSK